MMKVLFLVACLGTAYGGITRHLPLLRSGSEVHEEPAVEVREPLIPYWFTYGSNDPKGIHAREEEMNEDGTVKGWYRLSLADGRQRVVKYIADKSGFRAGIATNEQGTESKSPSDVLVRSDALSGPAAARAAEKDRLAAAATDKPEREEERHWKPRHMRKEHGVFFDNYDPQPDRLVRKRPY